MNLKTITIILGLLIAGMIPVAQAQQETRTVQRSSDYARPEPLGIGFALGFTQFAGDVQDGGTFPGADNPWKIGGNLFITARIVDLVEDLLTLGIRGRAGYYPLEASYQDASGQGYSFNNNAMQIGGDLIFDFFPKASIRPYGFGGVALLFESPENSITGDIWQTRWNRNKGEEESITGTFPLGFGIAWTVSEDFDVFFEFEKNLTFSDNLDLWKSNINDNYASLKLGLTFFLGSEKEEVVEVKPEVKDTDGDGLMDKDEVALYGTDPTLKDTDGEGLNDGDEVKRYRTDPTNPDTDGDRLNDRDEVALYKTNPLKKDTDNDGCEDGLEVIDLKTDPLKQDTDGDALTDCEERNTTRTNPLVVDTDGDGVNDGKEVENGTDPLVADILKVTESGNIVLEGITFETNKSEIRPESEPILQKALNTLKAYKDLKVEIQGHTDDVGSASANQRLSEARARAVRTWLIDRGIDPDRLTAAGYGESEPRVPNTSPENRAKNRRIEFRIIK